MLLVDEIMILKKIHMHAGDEDMQQIGTLATCKCHMCYQKAYKLISICNSMVLSAIWD